MKIDGGCAVSLYTTAQCCLLVDCSQLVRLSSLRFETVTIGYALAELVMKSCSARMTSLEAAVSEEAALAIASPRQGREARQPGG
jgi:hypothetical protein